MNVGIVADTHDDLSLVEATVDRFRERDVEVAIHCGDVVAPFAAAPFDDAFEFHAVRGNNDGEWALAETIGDFGTHHGEFASLEVGGARIAVYHGTSEGLVDALVDCGDYDYVCHGHTHERAVEERGGTVRINPGGIAIPPAPEPFHVAVLDVETGEVTHERPDRAGD